MAGQPAARWQWVLALPADLLAHREAADSNSVSEVPALAWSLKSAAGPQQASSRRAQQKLHGAHPRERLRAVWALPQQEIERALVLEKQADAPVASLQLDWAQEKSSVAPQVERRPASE